MKKCNRDSVSFQGDLMIIPVNEIPGDAKEVKTKDKNHVVAHSETGHHHVLSAQCARVYVVASAMMLYAKVIEQTELTHLRPYDTHEALSLPPGNYQLLRQREGSPQGWRQVAD